MSFEAVLLLATALLAVVAVTAAVVAVRAARRLAQAPAAVPTEPTEKPESPAASTAPVHAPVPVRIVEGRVIATPTEEQVVATALGRPAVRLSIYASGLAHALRPESRDRILALMRREYRHRRRVRQRIARRAARDVPTSALHPDATWLGAPDTAAEPRSLPRVAGQ